MSVRFATLSLSLLLAAAAFADQPMCGVSEEREELVRLHHQRIERERGPRIAANATALPATVRDGAFYMQADEQIASGARLFDLEGQSLVFEPRGGAKFAARKVGLRYDDGGTLLHDFAPKTGSPWHYVPYDLSQFSFPAFGKNVTRLYLTAFNAIELGVPEREEAASLVTDLEVAVHRNAAFSPLLITNRKPRQLAYPQLFVRETPEALFVTWKSVAGETFGYDVQAELRSDGTVVYSYKSMREMKWGTPVLAPGFDPAGTTPRRQLFNTTTQTGVSSTFGSLGPMLDIRNVEVSRMNESDLLAVRMKLGAPIDQSKIAEGQTVRYSLTVSNQPTYIDVTRTAMTMFPFEGISSTANGATIHVSGDTVEFYLLQSPLNVTSPQMRVFTQLRPMSADAHSFVPSLDVAPRASGGNDFSTLTASQELTAPLSEAFVLPELDVFEVWERLQPAFALSQEYDAVAIYQNFYTDMIFYAGAYSIAGNPGVNGIAPTSQTYGANAKKHPNLLHMNHFTYNYNAKEETGSQVILHEFGHRWLYFFRILESGTLANSLNPVSGHPAAFVHAPAAFPVFGNGESSTMGGAVFTQEGENSYRAKVANRGYSWTDLYLMGLASREEVMPWFYLAGTNLRGEYWPDDNVVVTGEKREVKIDQVIAAHGERNPSTALSQKTFRVLFVLVTEPGKEATDTDVAKLKQWRTTFEQTFYRATGGRAQVETRFVRPAKKRAVR